MALSSRILAEIRRLMRDPNALSRPSLPQQQHHRYDPSQPRVPAGNPHGGEWTKSGHGAASRGADDRAAPFPEGSDRRSIMHVAGQDVPLVPVAERGGGRGRGRFNPLELVDAAKIARYIELSALNNANQQAVLAFRAAQFGRTQVDVEFVQMMSREEIEKLCPLIRKVQKYTNDADAAVRTNHPEYSPQQTGTAVHQIVAGKIKALGRPELQAEVSLIKSIEAGYGKIGSVRIDAFERSTQRTDTVCIHDLKTGDRGLSFPRMHEMVRNSRNLHGTGITRYYVTEIRPMR